VRRHMGNENESRGKRWRSLEAFPPWTGWFPSAVYRMGKHYHTSRFPLLRDGRRTDKPWLFKPTVLRVADQD